jgi:diaminopimelate epimerase
LFPESINVEFVEVLDQYTLKMRVFERGCGETEACASGATAAVVSGVLSKKNALETLVIMKGGSLLIKVELSNQTVKQ